MGTKSSKNRLHPSWKSGRMSAASGSRMSSSSQAGTGAAAPGHLWKQQTRTEAPFTKGQVTPPNYLPHLLRINKKKDEEIECFKIHTHYRQSCAEKWPQRRIFKAEHREVLSRSQSLGVPWRGAEGAPPALGAAEPWALLGLCTPPKGAESSGQSYEQS